MKKMWIFYRDRGTCSCVSLILINNSSVFISKGYSIYSSKDILIKKTWAKTNINEYNKLTCSSNQRSLQLCDIYDLMLVSVPLNYVLEETK